MIVCLPVTADGHVDPRWGRAARVAVAEVRDGAIVRWEEHEVRWDVQHDIGTEGGHHARVAAFLRDHDVAMVVADHMGEPMIEMLGRMGVAVRLGAAGPAPQAALLAARPLA